MDKKKYLGIGSDYMLYSDRDELKKMTWKGPIFLSIRVCSHRITWASSVKGPEQNILLMFISQDFSVKMAVKLFCLLASFPFYSMRSM